MGILNSGEVARYTRLTSTRKCTRALTKSAIYNYILINILLPNLIQARWSVFAFFPVCTAFPLISGPALTYTNIDFACSLSVSELI